MGYWTGLQLYGVIALALAGTSYVQMYRPAIALLEEIVERKTYYSSWLGGFMWVAASTLLTPWTLYILLKNNNEEFIEEFAVTLADKLAEEEEEE